MQNIKPTSRELYNTLIPFEKYLIDEGFMTIIDGQLTMQPRKGYLGYSIDFLTTQYKMHKLGAKVKSPKK